MLQGRPGKARLLLGAAMIMGGAAGADARVVGFEVTSTAPVFDGKSYGGGGAYERIDAIATFAVDPSSPQGRTIVDLDKAATNDAGEVTFSTEVVILRPSDPAKRSSMLFYEVPNRGRNLSFMALNRSITSSMPETVEDAGDGFLMAHGYTLVWSGWQTDLADDFLNLSLPLAEGVTGSSREEFVFDDRETSTANLVYPAADLDPAKAALTVREKEADERKSVDGLSFRYLSPTEIEITRPSSMDAGAIYEFIYPAKDAVPNGLAFLALGDLVSFLRGRPGHDAENPLDGVEHTMAMGISQSGRFLRDFIYQGFNADETGERVFDGAMPHIAGSRKTFTNYRFAQPGRYSRQHEDHDYPGDQFPFTYAEATDPLTGKAESILSACSATDTCPKIMHTDTGTEFWQARASLMTTSPAGEPLDMPSDVRLYFLAGVPHFNAWPSEAKEAPSCTYLSNPLSPAPVLRALVVAMEDWITEGGEPPASRFPSLADGTLVPRDALKLPEVAGVVPDPISNPLDVMDHSVLPPKSGDAYPIFEPAVDQDGISEAGVKLPFVQAPLGTYYGWNLRKEGFAEGELCSLTGSYIPFPKAASADDGRKPLDERYASKQAYLDQVQAAADRLVADGFMLADDVGFVMERAEADAKVLD
ncbi:MAG: alpha/beta hydrolase domain-containing protein [Alphaproteobacteria bacterium]